MILLTTLLAITTCFNLNAAENNTAENIEVLQLLQQQKCALNLIKFNEVFDAKLSEFDRCIDDINQNAQEDHRYFQEVIEQSYENYKEKETSITAWKNALKNETLEKAVTFLELEQQKQEALDTYKEQFEADLKAFLENFKNDFRQNKCELGMKSNG